MPQVRFVAASFGDLPGWQADAVASAWSAWLRSCRVLGNRDPWRDVCARAQAVPGNPDDATARAYFEEHFVPWHLVSVAGSDSGLVTGYFEPLVRGSRMRKAPFLTPLYAPPDDLIDVDLASVYPELAGMRLRGRVEGRRLVPYPSRAEMAGDAALAGHELAWIDDPLDAFFLEVQGSGRVQIIEDGRPTGQIRLSYADQNGRPYRSIGRWLVDSGQLSVEAASMQGIRAWAEAHPERLTELLDANPSVVFFRELPLTDPDLGPPGALGVPLTPLRSLAVDRRVVPLGVPLFLATTRPASTEPFDFLGLAQDTGGAIRVPADAAVRADLFWGWGQTAAAEAGRMREPGRMWLLYPRGATPELPGSGRSGAAATLPD